MNYSIISKTIIAGLFACLASGSVQAITWKEYVKQNGVPQVVNDMLDLSWKELEDIDFKDIENKESITGLYLGNNQLQTLPVEIGKLKNLQVFDLSRNRLQALPGEIGQLKNLQVFGLGDNQLRALPGEIGQLENLQQLYLRGSELQLLPPTFSKLIATISFYGLSPEHIKESQERFEKLRRFIIKAVKENSLLKVHMFCRERGEPWHLHVNDFKDEQGNNLLHLAIKSNMQSEGNNGAWKVRDPEWKIFKELIACNTNDSAVAMLRETNEENMTPMEMLIAKSPGAFADIYASFAKMQEASDEEASENDGKQEEL